MSTDPAPYSPLKAPFPYFGGKSLAAPAVWAALGDVPNYIEPFAGSAAVLLLRPHAPKIETINDKSGFVCNFWRAMAADPDALAALCDWPVMQCDLTARHWWLVARKDDLFSRLEADPDYYDVQTAAWWAYGLCCWIGEGFGTGDGPWRAGEDHFGHKRMVKVGRGCGGVPNKLPHLGDAGVGIHRHLPHLGDAGKGIHSRNALLGWFRALAGRFRRVRVCCADFRKVLTPSVTTKHGITGVFLDPPYMEDGAQYDHSAYGVADAAREWAFVHGADPLFRIVLTGYDEFAAPKGWRTVVCRNRKGYAKSAARHKERLYLSPHCLKSADA